MPTTVRFATEADLTTIRDFIFGLARYERLEHDCHATEEALAATLFGPRSYAEVLIAEIDGKPVGFALFFHNYSTFLAKPGLYLEDLFVIPEARGCGAGKLLFTRLAQVAVERGCGRLEWWVLDWNTQAIQFYESLGAVAMSDWTVQRLSGEALLKLGSPRAQPD